MKTLHCLALWSISTIFWAQVSLAHQGRATAYAVPLKGIRIDGDLSDWPAQMIQYPIRNHRQFYGPTDIDDVDLNTSADLSPSFMVGFDPVESFLYLAVRVRDNRLKVGGSHHKQTDACEVYVDGGHRGERRIFWPGTTASDLSALQYVAIPGEGTYGFPDHRGNPSLFLGEVRRTQMAYARQEGVTVYEWAIEVFDHYPEAVTRLVPGKTIGFDVVVVDKDTDIDIPAWVCWGPFGGNKYLNADLLGDLVLVETSADLGAGTETQGMDFDPAATPGPMSGRLDPTWIFRAGVGALLAFSLLHLFLFVFYPRLRENLYYAIFTCCTAALVFINYRMDFIVTDQVAQMFHQRIFCQVGILVVVAGMRFLYAHFYPRLPRQFWGFAALGAGLGIWSWSTGADGASLFALIALPEMLRVILAAIGRKKEGAWIIGVGYLTFVLAGAYQALVGLNVFRSEVEYTYVYGFLGLLAAVSVSLARNFARANKDLEEQLIQIKDLSAQALEQERRLKGEEIERKLLEEELQTAHDMQMGLMPKAPPQTQGFEITGRCIPANHVGGDLFQYFQQGGILSFCLADVTGHAMQAAIPVVMFSGILENEMQYGHPLKQLFSNLNRTLNRKLDSHTYICFCMGELELSRRAFHLSNAGCPYPYHYRAATGEVEELRVDAYPLGVRPDTLYQTIEVQLEPGDRVVFCSDGIIEATNEAGEMFGFERAAEAVRQGCQEGFSAAALLERIMGEVKGFRGKTPQGDDQTVVVLKVES